jgi:hypothetical protein
MPESNMIGTFHLQVPLVVVVVVVVVVVTHVLLTGQLTHQMEQSHR